MKKILETETDVQNDKGSEQMMENILKVHACPCGKADCEYASDFFPPDVDDEETVTPYRSTCEYTMIDRNDDAFSTSQS